MSRKLYQDSNCRLHKLMGDDRALGGGRGRGKAEGGGGYLLRQELVLSEQY